MRRWRYQSYAGSRKANFRDPGINLAARKLTALAGLCALGHLDLQLARVDEIFACHTEASARDLFDGAISRIAVCVLHIARGIFAAFAGVALAADAIHRDRKRFMRFLADRSVGHRAGFE